MLLTFNNEKIFTDKWIKNCFYPENIPNNTLFSSYFFDENKKTNVHFYLKFDNNFYYFKGKNNTLTKMNSSHEFYKIKSLNEILATDVTNEDIEKLWKKYIALIQIDSEKKANNYELTKEDHDAFHVNGIKVTPVNGATGYTKKSSAINYDGVQYCILFFGNDYAEKKESIAHGLEHFKQIKERHHSLIKDVYSYLTEKLNAYDVFVIPSGGSRIEASFNFSGGHLATIILDMDTPEANINKGKDKFNMTVKKSDKLFEKFNHDKLNIIYQ